MTLTKIVTGVITDGTITSADMAVDPRNASNLNSGDVPLAQLDNVDSVVGLEEDIALLAFKTQANGNLARYNLIDQYVDSFEDADGVNASSSTNEVRNASNYYSGQTSTTPTATGGTITTYGDYTIHTFLTGANYVNDTAQDVDVLVVAGGGGGGTGGGGAGGMIANAGFSVAAGTYAVSIGTGGAAGSTSARGTNGTDSVFSTLTAIGGGGGGKNDSEYPEAQGAQIGGSGGGMGASSNPAKSQGAPGTAGQGNAGANTGSHASPYPANGGGGAGTTGFSGSGSSDGNGGNGLANNYRTGSNITYAGGGGGAYAGPGSGGSGGGGNGGAAGAANTGGGGGGNAVGGTGIVVVKRLTTEENVANMTLVSNSQTAQAQPTKADVVLTYTNGAGTATINTDIIASVSRDGGTTYTAATLASKGTTAGHTILTANDVTISGQPAGTSMVWKVVTANQSATKDTRIHGVSLGWS